MAWDIFLLLLLSYVAVMTPFSLGFAVAPSGFLWYWEVVIDFIFMFDGEFLLPPSPPFRRAAMSLAHSS